MRRVVLVLADGLRPNAITPGVMPSLDALGGMMRRVTHLGGAFRIDSQIERGTLLAITLPFEKTASYEYDKNPVS